MTDVLDLASLAREQKIPVRFLLDLANEIINDGKADRVVDDRYLVKFQGSDYGTVRLAITNKKTLAELCQDLGVEQNIAAELVEQYGRSHPEISRQSLDALVITDHADARIEIPLQIKETEVEKLFSLPLRIFSDRDLKNVQFNISTSSGLEIIEKPSPVPLLPQTEDGYAEVVRVRGSSFGKQMITCNLVGDDNGIAVRRSIQTQIQVHPKSPDVSVEILSIPPQVIYFGKEFSLSLQLANTGAGEARSVQIEGFDKFLGTIKVVRDIPSQTAIHPGSSIETGIMLQAVKSGDLVVEGLSLSFSDTEGRKNSRTIPSFATKIVTLQPELKVRFSAPKPTGFENEVRLEYSLSNSGLGISKNLILKATPISGANLIRGALSRRIATLQQGQTEVGQFDFQLKSTPTALVFPIEKIELSYLDEEEMPHKIELSANELNTPTDDNAQPAISMGETQQQSQNQAVQMLVQKEGNPSDLSRDQHLDSVLQNANSNQTTTTITVSQMRSLPQGRDASPLQRMQTLKFMLQTKESFGTNFSAKKWLSILDESDSTIDLGVLGVDKNNHAQQGYLNLLVAIYDSKLEDYELEEKIKNDSYSQLMLTFLRRLKAKQRVEYDPNGSTYSTIKSIIEKLFAQGDSSEDKLTDGSRVLTRKLSFENSTGEVISILRETQISPTRGAIDIAFSLAEDGSAATK
jgi:hypothetical protein